MNWFFISNNNSAKIKKNVIYLNNSCFEEPAEDLNPPPYTWEVMLHLQGKKIVSVFNNIS